MKAVEIDIKSNPFRAARRAGVPIIGIETSDPAATIVKCTQALNGKHEITPLMRWDIVTGIKPLNNAGADCLAHFSDELPMENPVLCLKSLVAKPDKLLNHPDQSDPDKTIGAIVFMIHANRWICELDGMQAVWNARDAFEPHGITLVLLGPVINLPIELKNDVVIINEPLPSHEELDGILTKISKDAKLDASKIEDRETIVDTMTGTSAFGARQILAMSVTRESIDTDQLWERKRKMIEATPGLSVWKGGETFNELGGLANLKGFLTRILTSGNTPVRAILFLDELEKSLAGAAGDLSGTSQDQLGALLTTMQDQNIPGMILLGPPGTGKSSIAKAAGNVANAPVIACDLGAMKGSLVGQSEQQIRSALQVFHAISDGKGLAIATCNKLTSLPPELKRRFSLGTFMIDLPSESERSMIWKLWLKHYDLEYAVKDLPNAEGWTGAELKACCDVAFRTGLTMKEAAAFIVPVSKSSPESVQQLRQLANGRFINAHKPGIYQYSEFSSETKAETTTRKIQV